MTFPAPTRVLIAIQLNGAATETAVASLAELLAEHGFASLKVATAINGDFVPEHDRANIRIKPGDAVEVVSARQGG